MNYKTKLIEAINDYDGADNFHSFMTWLGINHNELQQHAAIKDIVTLYCGDRGDIKIGSRIAYKGDWLDSNVNYKDRLDFSLKRGTVIRISSSGVAAINFDSDKFNSLVVLDALRKIISY